MDAREDQTRARLMREAADRRDWTLKQGVMLAARIAQRISQRAAIKAWREYRKELDRISNAR